MCDYCGCLTRPLIAELSEEHERIGLLAKQLAAAWAAPDRAAARALAAELLSLLEPHTQREEAVLFPELAASGAGAHTAELERDHSALDAVFSAAAAGEEAAWAQLPAALERLHAHIWREDYDVFPAALQLLDDDAWTRVSSGSSSMPARSL